MKLIDLHIHTNASDGSYTPSEICSMAYETGLSAIAITDHDTVDGLEEAMSYAADNNITTDIMEIIPGIELSCKYKEREIHILGLYMDYKNPQLLQKLNNIKEARFNRNVEMCKLFQADGIDMTIEKLQAGNPNTVITRAHFARVLLEEGIVKTKDQAFKKYIGRNNKYYLPKPDISCDEAMDIINNYSKAAILAHPLLYKFGYAQIEEMLDYLKTLGLVGLEAYHSSNNSYESGKLRSIAYAHNLCISGGTDFHGVIKPDIKLGCGRGGMKIPYKLLEEIKASIN